MVGQVAVEGSDSSVAELALKLLSGRVETLAVATGNDRSATFLQQSPGNRLTDTSRGTSNEGDPLIEVKFQIVPLYGPIAIDKFNVFSGPGNLFSRFTARDLEREIARIL